MKEHHRITKQESALDETFNMQNSLNVRVISDSGFVVGKVSQIRIHPTKMVLEGIVVSPGFLKKPIYIGRSYIKKLSEESFILNIYPSILLKGENVLDTEGRKIGKVSEVVRKEHSNEIRELIVSSPFRKKFVITPQNIKHIGESIILKPNYHVQKKYFWQKS